MRSRLCALPLTAPFLRYAPRALSLSCPFERLTAGLQSGADASLRRERIPVTRQKKSAPWEGGGHEV